MCATPTDSEPLSGLTARDREILRDVVATFLGTGEPVSSRRVAKLRRHGLSAATIRNVMADLEDHGLLVQPHTSAGRVPTEIGYHVYIDSLMPSRGVPAELRRQIDDSLTPEGSGDELTTVASQLLSELSQQIGIVVVPALGETVLRSISFVPLSGRRALCVLVSANGFVDNKVIETQRRVPRDELIRISNYLTDNFGGMTLRQIRDRLLGLMAEERAQMDRLLASAIDLARDALIAGDPELRVEGTSSLLMRPELADVERVRRLLDTFADKARLVQLLNRLIEGQGVRVVIGQESDLTSDLDFSLVATSYGLGDQPLGTMGIFGPSRMDYAAVIPLVNYLGDRLSQALERTLS
jgi:heat-inducible transcriptional repressor